MSVSISLNQTFGAKEAGAELNRVAGEAGERMSGMGCPCVLQDAAEGGPLLARAALPHVTSTFAGATRFTRSTTCRTTASVPSIPWKRAGSAARRLGSKRTSVSHSRPAPHRWKLEARKGAESHQ